MNLEQKRATHLHFVGIGGIGMSGIAEVFFNQGYVVSGSDLNESETTEHLARLGVRVAIGHRAENVRGSKVVVISSAVRPDNPEVVEAKRLRIPVIPRAEMLGELMRGKHGIAVAGTHGKTTTTSMLATILSESGFDPTIVIGGKVDSFGGNAKLGQGAYVVAEADESDGSFLHLPAMESIITNIDNDHLDHFGGIEQLDTAFVDFVSKIPFYGVTAVCAEDPGVRRCMSRWKKPVLTYGFSSELDCYAKNIEFTRMGSRFEVFWRDAPAGAHENLGRMELHVPGKHNVLNALAAICIARKLGVTSPALGKGLSAFQGVKRRFEIIWKDEARNRALIDDYAHHPTEISATLAAARTFWPAPKRIITLFQPHRYSRTLHCRDGFLSAFRESQVVLISDIYAAGEAPIEGVSAQSLVKEMAEAALPGQTIEYVGALDSAARRVLGEIRDGDLVLCLGAGSITRMARKLASEIRSL